jgi:hypothetical protein
MVDVPEEMGQLVSCCMTDFRNLLQRMQLLDVGRFQLGVIHAPRVDRLLAEALLGHLSLMSEMEHLCEAGHNWQRYS